MQSESTTPAHRESAATLPASPAPAQTHPAPHPPPPPLDPQHRMRNPKQHPAIHLHQASEIDRRPHLPSRNQSQATSLDRRHKPFYPPDAPVRHPLDRMFAAPDLHRKRYRIDSGHKAQTFRKNDSQSRSGRRYLRLRPRELKQSEDQQTSARLSRHRRNRNLLPPERVRHTSQDD